MLGKQVVVMHYLGGGGQGDVYEVLYDGKHMALKWYHPSAIRNPISFVHNLKHNIYEGAPTPDFLWPLDMTDFYDGVFGYVMDLRPEEYEEVNAFLLGNVNFPSYRRVIDACLNIVAAFDVLHDYGYAYQDVNSKNFFLVPETGKLLICDNDNVAPDDNPVTGIMGTWGYMAPEVVRGASPNTQSDLHSLAVVLFQLLFKVHPLEGMAMSGSVFSDSERVRLYGTEPLFVFDAKNHANALDPETRSGAIALWEQLPTYLRDLFIRAFSQEALQQGLWRPIEKEWLSAFAQFRSEVQACPCGRSELVVPADGVARCEHCGETLRAPLVLEVRDTALPALYDTRVYACQTRLVRPECALELEAWVVRDSQDPSALGLYNMGKQTWEVRSSRGSSQVAPKTITTLVEGMEVTAPQLRLKVRAGR